MTPPTDDTEVDERRTANPLAPLFERAARAATIEQRGTSPVPLTLIDDEWLLLTGDDAELSEHGRWIASDAFVDLNEYR